MRDSPGFNRRPEVLTGSSEEEAGGSRRTLGTRRPPEDLAFLTLLDMLTEISEWLEKHPREVVPLACRNFQGLSTDLHKYLVTCIQNIFGDMLCPRREVPTLRLLWARSQQVIIFCEDEDTLSWHRELSTGVRYWWGNKVKVQELIRYLEGMKSSGRPGTWSYSCTGPD
ncbi:PI-PLC X domain-containing protein 1-like [Cynocephalus volans]|uniref:PI-PLC X domain-containing protein 1-like n=1 Tax=Cynocephalus volans TaxID=110931 RepID=UPI002FCA8354